MSLVWSRAPSTISKVSKSIHFDNAAAFTPPKRGISRVLLFPGVGYFATQYISPLLAIYHGIEVKLSLKNPGNPCTVKTGVLVELLYSILEFYPFFEVRSGLGNDIRGHGVYGYIWAGLWCPPDLNIE
jgi:hypothetical protein